ncbi:hypothetical protein [Sulfitobacter dubius]|uniref:hypothetical protein n=1 Tax=Sulfitobacter dubius TaxID=218673 RepID=UPI0029433E97|nr:hypothetical protein [Sulfitobacter dubius]WOI29356.1 hypothetical protein R1T39_01200 [Sulfitobacter dubius]
MENQTNKTATADGEDMRAVFAKAAKEEREKVQVWNERANGWRAKTGHTGPLPVEFFEHHPARGYITHFLKVFECSARGGGAEVKASQLLSKLSKDERGTILFEGTGEEGLLVTVDCFHRAARIAMENFNFVEAGLADKQADLWEHLRIAFWDVSRPDEPLHIAIREAVY